MGDDVLKSYLVKLGWDIDQKSYGQMKKVLEDLSKAAEKHASNWGKSFIAAAGVITGAIAAINTATIGLIDNVARADMEYKKFALRMYMAEGQAKKLKIATDALGESIDDIAWIPELRQRYFSLMSQQGRIEQGMPGDFNTQMRQIRDLQFEFTKLKVNLTWGAQMIGYQLSKALHIDDFEKWLRKINAYLEGKMPEWTKKVSDFITPIIQFSESVVKTVFNVVDKLIGYYQRAPDEVKKKGLIGALLGFGFMPGPLWSFRAFLTLLSGAVYLLNDLFNYLDGKNSSQTLAPVWKQLMTWWEQIQTWSDSHGGIEGFMKIISEALDNSWKKLQSWWEKFRSWWEAQGGIRGIADYIYSVFSKIAGFLIQITRAAALLLHGEPAAAAAALDAGLDRLGIGYTGKGEKYLGTEEEYVDVGLNRFIGKNTSRWQKNARDELEKQPGWKKFLRPFPKDTQYGNPTEIEAEKKRLKEEYQQKKKEIEGTGGYSSIEGLSGGMIKMAKGTIGYRHNNPMNLMYLASAAKPGGIQEGATQGEPKKGGGYWARFETPEAGYQAALRQIELDQRRGYTLAGLINKYGPPHENNTEWYIGHMAKKLGISPNDPASNVSSAAIAKHMLAIETGSALVAPKTKPNVMNGLINGQGIMTQGANASYSTGFGGPSQTYSPSVANSYQINIDGNVKDAKELAREVKRELEQSETMQESRMIRDFSSVFG